MEEIIKPHFAAMKGAAQSALRYFTDIKSIKSTNNPFARITRLDQKILDDYRENSPDTLSDSFNDASRFGIGNCDEKGRICYTSLKSNPVLHKYDLEVTLCESIDYDHVFVVVSSNRVQDITRIEYLGKLTMIVDGWTEDYYFPNLSLSEAMAYDVLTLHNPRQLWIQSKTTKHSLQEYGSDDDGMPDLY